VDTLVGNGFFKERLMGIIKQFLCANPFPGLKFDIQLLINTLN